MRRRLLVVADRPANDDWWQVADALIGHLSGERGWKISLLVWDRSDLPRGSAKGRRVREIESINRWRLPQTLERWGQRAAMRKLRHAVVRWWWFRWRGLDAVLLVGPLRPEVSHYLPRGGHTTAALLDSEADRPPTSAGPTAEVTCGLASQTVGPPRSLHDTRVASGTWERHRRRLGLRPASIVIGGMGPGTDDPVGGIDRFLRAFWAVRDTSPGVDLQALWIGTEASTSSIEIRHTLWQLHLTEDVLLLPDAEVGPHLSSAIDILALTARGPFRGWRLSEVRAAGVPVVRFDLALVDDGLHDRTCAYGDVEGLARGLTGEVDARFRHRASAFRALADLERIFG